jgi:hypothetical protein
MHSRRPRCLAQDEPPRLCSRHTLKLQITTNRGRPADAFVGRLTLASRWLWIFLQHRRRCQYLASGFHRRRGRHLGDLQDLSMRRSGCWNRLRHLFPCSGWSISAPTTLGAGLASPTVAGVSKSMGRGTGIQAAAAYSAGGSWKERIWKTWRRWPLPQFGQRLGSMACLLRKPSRSAM